MRLLKKDRSGVSEIVGAMMLVLIVVIAASSLAVFISQYQQSAQAQKLDDQKKSQENIQVTSIVPISGTDYDDKKWKSLNFTIASLHNERTEITRISINDHMIRNYEVLRVNPSSGSLENEKHSAQSTLNLAPRDEIIIHLDVEDPLAFYIPGVSLLTSGYVKIDITTAWSNGFSKTFAPPSAVLTAPSLSNWLNKSTGNQEYYIVLNGRSSVAYGGAYIVSWNWTVTSTNLTDSDPNTRTVVTYLTGPVCNFYLPFNKDATYAVNLTVTDNYGMVGKGYFPLYYL
ncbi:type IV pilin N-terminal domain-containing protein [Methanomassiliicoccus luminyensis]|uniref:type IV pilin N-terminal domain-containing protein n=1 Tax=Methanomassiliicoccus luminyensis TaxID=1080712 RepID=UPI00036D4661|nr:type IV pilin N-terminal domain-containing protein [Methanomassiliicoccus luminyensis]